MSLTRRDFLTRGSLALAGGLLVGDEVLEAFARLTHTRTMFPSAALSRGGIVAISDADLQGTLQKVYARFRLQMQNTVTPILAQLENTQRQPRSLYAPPRPQVREVYYEWSVPRIA